VKLKCNLSSTFRIHAPASGFIELKLLRKDAVVKLKCNLSSTSIDPQPQPIASAKDPSHDLAG
jgi:hypothetical protein